MIDLYYAATPNGHKLTMAFEEMGMPYRIVRVDIGKGDQFKPAFLAISPNNKIPALVDQDPADGGEPIAVFESGAMLWYLANRSGKLLPTDERARLEVMKWLFWQVGGLGPMAGQAGHFRVFAKEPHPYSIDRYTNETARLYRVLDTRLEGREFIVDQYSIADVAAYPWIVPHQGHGQNLDDFPNVKRWFDAIAVRPATIRAYGNAKDPYAGPRKEMSEEERRVLFGASKPA